jgi:hypothetical protein
MAPTVRARNPRQSRLNGWRRYILSVSLIVFGLAMAAVLDARERALAGVESILAAESSSLGLPRFTTPFIREPLPQAGTSGLRAAASLPLAKAPVVDSSQVLTEARKQADAAVPLAADVPTKKKEPSSAAGVPRLRESVNAEDAVLGSDFNSHAGENAPWWAWAKPEKSSESTPLGYRCVPLNSQFSPPKVITARYDPEGGRLARSLDYGTWRIRWPRFIRPSHSEWFSKTGLVRWRLTADACVAEYEDRRSRAQEAHVDPDDKRWSFLSPEPLLSPKYSSSFLPPETAHAWPPGSPSMGGWAAPPDLSHHWLHFCEARYTIGEVTVSDGVTLSEAPGGHDCGPDGDFERLVQNAAATSADSLDPPPSLDPLFWAVIPATWTWQHWCENTLPKMAQAMAAIRASEVHGSRDLKTSGLNPFWAGMAANQEILDHRFPIVTRIYRDVLNMTPVDIRDRAVKTPRAVYACRAPPLHPYLWQLGQSSVFATGAPAPLSSRRKLVYCSRRDAATTEHPGRLFLNEIDVVNMLKAKCALASCELVTFNHRNFNNSVALTAEFFKDAIGLISPHGGCLTNVNLLPCNAGVVEVMPLTLSDEPTEPHWHMLYMQAVMLEHRYYMLPVRAADGTRDDMQVPLDELSDIVDEILAAAPEIT